MDTAFPEDPKASQELERYQFGLRRMLAATMALAAVFGLAAWGGWVRSDAAVYLSIAAVAAVFSSGARRALLGACVIIGALWLAMFLGGMVFGMHGRGCDPRSFWIFAGFLTASAVILRLYTKACVFSLVASLVLAETFAAIVIVYTYGRPTLFQAFANEDRAYVLQHLRNNFVLIQQWLIVVPWLAGIVLGWFFARNRKGRQRPQTTP